MKRFENIAVDEFHQIIGNDNYWIIDIRDKEQFQEKHVKNAISIPLENIEHGYFWLSPQKEVIVYCERGGSSVIAARILQQKGYKVKMLVGGIQAYWQWVENGDKFS